MRSIYVFVYEYVYVGMGRCVCTCVSVSGPACENLSVGAHTYALTHTHTSHVHMSMRPFLWVNIFLPASARSQSAGSSLQERALSDPVRDCGPRTGGWGWAGSPSQLPREGYSLSTRLLKLSKEAGPEAPAPDTPPASLIFAQILRPLRPQMFH